MGGVVRLLASLLVVEKGGIARLRGSGTLPGEAVHLLAAQGGVKAVGFEKFPDPTGFIHIGHALRKESFDGEAGGKEGVLKFTRRVLADMGEVSVAGGRVAGVRLGMAPAVEHGGDAGEADDVRGGK